MIDVSVIELQHSE